MLEELGLSGALDFSSSWYDPRSNVEHVLVTSDRGAANVHRLATKHGVNVEVGRARFRYYDLTAHAKRINARITPDKARSVFAVADTRANRVKIITQNKARAEEARTQFARDPRVVVVQAGGTAGPTACTSRTSCGTPFRSGIAVGPDMDAAGSGSATHVCSAAFTAVSNEGSKWLVTAGHCTGDNVDDGVVSYCGDGSNGGCWGHGGQYWGAMRDSQPYGYSPYANVDVARARKDNTYWSSGGYIYNAGAPSSPFDVDYAIQSRISIEEGDTVCQSMWYAVTGSYCGTVSDPTSSYWYGMVRATVDSCQGDSGGGWYQWINSERWAVGVQSAADNASSCHNSNEQSYFSAVPDINDYWDDTSTLSPIRTEVR